MSSQAAGIEFVEQGRPGRTQREGAPLGVVLGQIKGVAGLRKPREGGRGKLGAVTERAVAAANGVLTGPPEWFPTPIR